MKYNLHARISSDLQPVWVLFGDANMHRTLFYFQLSPIILLTLEDTLMLYKRRYGKCKNKHLIFVKFVPVNWNGVFNIIRFMTLCCTSKATCTTYEFLFHLNSLNSATFQLFIVTQQCFIFKATHNNVLVNGRTCYSGIK